MKLSIMKRSIKSKASAVNKRDIKPNDDEVIKVDKGKRTTYIKRNKSAIKPADNKEPTMRY
jgi:hypothetical protein